MTDAILNTKKRRKPLVALILSLIEPGLGHIYCGRIAKGLVLAFIASVIIPVFFATLSVSYSHVRMAVILISLFALKKFKALFGKEVAKKSEVEIRSDSELMVKQLNGEFKVVNENIQPLFLDIWNLKIDFLKVKFKQIPREKNKEADRLVNEALDTKTKTQKLI